MKKATKRIVPLMLCLAMLTATFTGCNSKGKAKKLEDTTINGEEAMDLQFIRPGQDPDKEDDPVVMAIKEYEELYGVNVQIVSADYDTWKTSVLSASASGNPIDVIFGSVSEYPLFAMKGYTQPISKYVDMDSEYVSLPASKEFFSLKGEIYSAAVADVSPLVLYYNKQILDEEGLEDPMELYKNDQWTFDKFKDMCKKVTTDTDSDGKIDRWGLCCWYPWAWLGANHTALCTIDENGLYKLNLTDPAVTRASEFVQDMYYTSNWRGLDGDSIFTSFFEGKNAFLQEYSWVEKSTILEAKNNKQFDFEYGVCPTPYGPDNTEKTNVAHSSGYGIGTGSKNPYHAGKLIEMILKYVADDAVESNKDLPEESVALYKELGEKIFNDSFYDSCIDNGNDYFNLICGGTNIQTALSQVESMYADYVLDANESATE